MKVRGIQASNKSANLVGRCCGLCEAIACWNNLGQGHVCVWNQARTAEHAIEKWRKTAWKCLNFQISDVFWHTTSWRGFCVVFQFCLFCLCQGLGGTCVNVGCIPKKLMHISSLYRETQVSNGFMYIHVNQGKSMEIIHEMKAWLGTAPGWCTRHGLGNKVFT